MPHFSEKVVLFVLLELTQIGLWLYIPLLYLVFRYRRNMRKREISTQILILKSESFWRLSPGGCGYLPHCWGDKQPQSWDTNTCALFSSNSSSNITMQAQLPPSVRSSNYWHYGASPAEVNLPATRTFVACLQMAEQIKNWKCVSLNYTATRKEAYKYHASLQIGTDKCLCHASVPWNLYHMHHFWGV
jgi:hypothetical protein